MDKGRNKWTAIIRKIIDVILFLRKQNLSFRGHRENVYSTVKIIARYNPVMTEHLSDSQV